MNTNNAYFIGHDHTVCEDYAVCGSTPELTYAVVSDGCSASPDVDFGARALAMSAKQTFRLHGDDFNCVEFGQESIERAKKTLEVFPFLSPQCLDATLLVAWVKNGHADFFMYGDGVVIIRKKDWTLGFHVRLTSGAPDYLSYTLDPMRKQSYENLEDNVKVISTYNNNLLVKNELSLTEGKPLMPYIGGVVVESGDVIAVISDGINSFRKADYTPIEWVDLIDEFTAFKNLEGDFALRRISAFKRKCLKDGIVHGDDISIAAIVV